MEFIDRHSIVQRLVFILGKDSPQMLEVKNFLTSLGLRWHQPNVEVFTPEHMVFDGIDLNEQFEDGGGYRYDVWYIDISLGDGVSAARLRTQGKKDWYGKEISLRREVWTILNQCTDSPDTEYIFGSYSPKSRQLRAKLHAMNYDEL
jgi:hypothetical protein